MACERCGGKGEIFIKGRGGQEDMWIKCPDCGHKKEEE